MSATAAVSSSLHLRMSRRSVSTTTELIALPRARVLRSFDRNEFAWPLSEIEGVDRCSRARIAGRQPLQTEDVLDEAKDARGLVMDVRNIVIFRIRRNNQ